MTPTLPLYHLPPAQNLNQFDSDSNYNLEENEESQPFVRKTYKQQKKKQNKKNQQLQPSRLISLKLRSHDTRRNRGRFRMI